MKVEVRDIVIGWKDNFEVVSCVRDDCQIYVDNCMKSFYEIRKLINISDGLWIRKKDVGLPCGKIASLFTPREMYES